MNSNKKHIFIAYTKTGMGHKVPAQAIAQTIEELYPDKYKITCSDFFEDAGETKFNKYIETAWELMLRYPICTKFVIFLGKLMYWCTHCYMLVFHPFVLKRSVKYLRDINPDIVFSTHWFPQTVALDVKKHYPDVTFPIITFNPDTFETFPFWDYRGEYLLVCSEQAKKKALRWRHKIENIRVVPPAFRKEFNQTESVLNREEICKTYNIPQDKFVILMSDGGQGVGKMYACVKQLIKLERPIHILAVCAKNDKLYDKLIALQQSLLADNSLITFTLFRYTDDVQTLISVSDLFIGKSGPSTVLECLKMKLPVLITYSASSAERNVVKFFQKENVLWTSNVRRLNKHVTRLMDHPEILNDVRNKIATLTSLKNGSQHIAQIVVGSLEKSTIRNTKNPIL